MWHWKWIEYLFWKWKHQNVPRAQYTKRDILLFHFALDLMVNLYFWKVTVREVRMMKTYRSFIGNKITKCPWGLEIGWIWTRNWMPSWVSPYSSHNIVSLFIFYYFVFSCHFSILFYDIGMQEDICAKWRIYSYNLGSKINEIETKEVISIINFIKLKTFWSQVRNELWQLKSNSECMRFSIKSVDI